MDAIFTQIWWRDMRTNSSWKRSNGFSDTLRNNSKIPYGSHWLQCFLELRLLQKTAMLVTSAEREVEPSIPSHFWQMTLPPICPFIPVKPMTPLLKNEARMLQFVTLKLNLCQYICVIPKYLPTMTLNAFQFVWKPEHILNSNALQMSPCLFRTHYYKCIPIHMTWNIEANKCQIKWYGTNFTLDNYGTNIVCVTVQIGRYHAIRSQHNSINKTTCQDNSVLLHSRHVIWRRHWNVYSWNTGATSTYFQVQIFQ